MCEVEKGEDVMSVRKRKSDSLWCDYGKLESDRHFLQLSKNKSRIELIKLLKEAQAWKKRKVELYRRCELFSLCKEEDYNKEKDSVVMEGEVDKLICGDCRIQFGYLRNR